MAIHAFSADGTPSPGAQIALDRINNGGGGNAAQVEYTGTAWPARPDIDSAVTWLSTKYEDAPLPPVQPDDPDGMAVGDMLIRHPGAA